MSQNRRTADRILDQKSAGLVQSFQQNMRWRDRRQSTNVEDRRGTGGRNMAIGGSLGLGTIVVVLLVLLLGGNPADVLQQLPFPGAGTSQTSVELTAADQELGQFISVVLADTEDVWTQLFHEEGRTYSPPTMVLFTDWTESACGSADALIQLFKLLRVRPSL